jgi:hypothetical protein
MSTHLFEGGCHCGNLSYVFETSVGLHVLGLRACQCSFCRRHNARTTSDPKGTIRVSVREPGKLHRYRFGLKTADFLICADCGVYIGAALEDGGKGWMTVNVNTFRSPPPFEFTGTPHDFESETAGDKIDRRKAKWTPLEIAT